MHCNISAVLYQLRYQAKGCLKNSDLENLDPRPKKLRPSGWLENSEPKNSDPLGVSKTQTRKIKHIYTTWMPQADLFTVRQYRILIKSLCYIKENINKEPFIHSVYTQLFFKKREV